MLTPRRLASCEMEPRGPQVDGGNRDNAPCHGVQNFSAGILVGGKSRRMGTEKSALIVHGEILIERQLRTVRQVGASQVLLSFGSQPDIRWAWAQAEVSVVIDRYPDRGPLAGIEACLRCAKHPWVMIVAIDLPCLTPEFFFTLLRECLPGRGMVTVSEKGYEPLSAVYPRTAHAIALRRLRADQLSLQGFVEEAQAAGLVNTRRLNAAEMEILRNWNYPTDMHS
jgi:molybdopterin-guanine dinucleotide biosynthesis protein A